MPSALFHRAQKFAKRLQSIKERHPAPAPNGWYGYDIMSNVWVIEMLLGERFADLLARYDGPVADIGAADGDLGYFLESEGRSVHFMDLPHTNWNGMQGMRQLHTLLDSKAEIHQVDLDTQFTLKHERYGLVLLLGILYHLKNPFFALEQLARNSQSMLLSTRVAAVAGPADTPIRDLPVAYLVDTLECNGDPTNFWIFSETGLRRILARSGWDVEAFLTVGCESGSNPVDNAKDQRAFVLARSRFHSAG